MSRYMAIYSVCVGSSCISFFIKIVLNMYIALCVSPGDPIISLLVFTSQSLRTVRILFSPIVSGWAGGGKI